MLSQSVEYALRAIVYLADQAPAPRTNKQIADVTLVPQAYLSKILQSLSKAGLVHSQRGVHGGFELARDSSEITVLQVVDAVDPLRRIRECPLGLKSHGIRLCPLHRRLDNAIAAVQTAFADTKIADILSERSGSVPLCDVTGTLGNGGKRPTGTGRR